MKLNKSRRASRSHRPFVDSLEPRTLLTSTLLADINPQPIYPANITSIGGLAYFTASDGGLGYNLMKSNGTQGGTSVVAQSLPVPPLDLTSLSGKPIFHVGGQVDTIDSVTGKLVTIANYESATPGNYPYQFVSVGNRVYYRVANNDGTPDSLDVTDGTAQGTTRLLDHVAFPKDGTLPMAALGQSLIFGTSDPVAGPQLWLSDGTSDGTRLLTNLNGVSAGSVPKDFITDGGRVFFLTSDTASSTSTLWVSDGTAGGTKTLGPVSQSFITDRIVAGHGRVYGVSNGLLTSDGTSAGTVVIPINQVGPDNDLAVLANGHAVFTQGNVLWASDGTKAGTVPLKSITPTANNSVGSSVPSFVVAGGFAYFSAWDAANGGELWKTDGTVAGTSLVRDIMPGAAGSDPVNFQAVGSRVYFAARDSQGENELWSSDGTSAGTTRAAILPNPVNQGSNAFITNETQTETAVNSGGITYFLATDPDHGKALWRTDGTVAGTFILPESLPGPGSNSANSVGGLVAWKGGLAFVAIDASNRQGIYFTDGSIAGTSKIVDLTDLGLGYSLFVNGSDSLTVLGNQLYFLGNSPTANLLLISSDGTQGGTAAVTTLNGTSYSHLVTVGNQLYFTTSSQSFPGSSQLTRLWVSDGTSDGTQALSLLSPASGSSLTLAQSFTQGSVLYFTFQGSDLSRQVWRTDGTLVGTYLLKSLPVIPNDHLSFATLGSLVYFGADDGSGHNQIYQTDGTVAGTKLAVDLGLRNNATPTSLSVQGGSLWFEIPDGPRAGIYQSDGTQAGTIRKLSAEALGTADFSSVFGPLIDLGTGFAFTFGDSGTTNLFRTDGAGAATILASGISLVGTEQEARVFPSGDLLVFASDLAHGVEPLLIGASPTTNHPPQIEAIPDLTTRQGQEIDVFASATDVDPGQTLSYSLAPGAPSGTTIDSSTGALVWHVPSDLPVGRYSIGIVATDNAAIPSSAVTRFNVSVYSSDGSPQIGFIPNMSVAAGNKLTFTVGATNDIQGGNLKFSLDPGAPAGATIDPVSGLFQYTPTNQDVLATFTVRVANSNPTAKSSARSFTILQTGLSPSLDLGGNAAFTLPQTFARSGRVTNPYGLPISAQVDYGDGTTSPSLALAADGTFSLNHAYSTAGNYTVRVTATDSRGRVATSQISVSVTAIPLVTSSSAVTLRKNTITSLVVRFSADVAGAGSASSYRLVQLVKKGRKTIMQPIKIKTVRYDALTHTATLVPKKAIPKTALLRFTVVASAIHDAQGRPLAGGLDSVVMIRRGVVGG